MLRDYFGVSFDGAFSVSLGVSMFFALGIFLSSLGCLFWCILASAFGSLVAIKGVTCLYLVYSDLSHLFLALRVVCATLY